LAVHLYLSLREIAKRNGGLKFLGRVAVITPYSQQASLLRKFFRNALGQDISELVEVNTVDAFQGREGMEKCCSNRLETVVTRRFSLICFFWLYQQMLSFFQLFVQQEAVESDSLMMLDE
jgi:hypothetical protein